MPVTAGITLAAATIDRSVHQAIDQRRQQKSALGRQRDAQEQARVAAIRTQRENEMAIAAANRRQPDLLSILDFEQRAASARAGTTMLTGPRGVTDPLLLGGPTQLGL